MDPYIPNITFPQHWQDDPEVIRRQAADVLHVARENELQKGRPLTALEWFVSGLKTRGEDLPENPRKVVTVCRARRSPLRSPRKSTYYFRTPTTRYPTASRMFIKLKLSKTFCQLRRLASGKQAA